MEAEYVTCFFALQDIVRICQLLKDLSLERYHPTLVYIDNISVRQVHHHQSKPIDTKNHWILDLMSSGAVQLIHVVTEDQWADILTKMVLGVVFWRHIDTLISTHF